MRRSRLWLLRTGIGSAAILIVLIGGFVLVTSVTASTTVPTSDLSKITQTHLVSQFAPTGCSTLNVTSLVTGSGTFSNSLSHALILGSPNADTITDHGTNNCIIGGGGMNVISAPASDICITGPTLSIAGPCASPSNGVTATPSSDSYGNYGGQERITLANTHSITALTLSISVAETAGVGFGSQENSFPGGALADTHTISSGRIIYTFTLNAGQSITANYQGGTAYAQFSGTGSTHLMSGDTWTVTSTSNGTVETLNGTF